MAPKKPPQPTSDQWKQLADALGISVEQAHQKVAATEGGQTGQSEQVIQDFLSQAGADPSQAQLRGGAEKYGGYSASEWASLSPEQKAQAISGYVNDPSTELFSPGTIKKVKGEVASGGLQPLPDPAKAAASTPESPFQQLAQALAGEYLGQVQQLMPLTSGQAIPGLTNSITSQAAAAVPGAGGWLQQQAAAEQQAAAPMFAAMNQVGEAQAQGAIPYAGAIANTGTANTQYLEAAPWQQILSELASETAYKAASTQGASAFGATPQNTPAFLQQIFKNLGLAGTAQGPAGGLTAPGAAAKGGSGSTSTGLSSTPSQTG
jgi:hypothetical protein